VAVNCGAIPSELIESELFGHVRGSFTGAERDRRGLWEEADGGTIFLDEVTETTPAFQVKLLRSLQEGEIRRVGSNQTQKLDVRVIAASNGNVEEEVKAGRFRQDLFYRLNAVSIVLPRLRDRREDILPLTKYFAERVYSLNSSVAFSPEALALLETYPWPGNIRELENIIERALILSREGELEYGDWVPVKKADSNGKVKVNKMEEVEKDHILSILKQTNWKVSGEKGAAKMLGLNATTLEARMKKLGIVREK